MTYRMQSGTVARFAAFVALVVAPALPGYAADSSGAHVFARRSNGTNIVSRLVPDGTDVATAGAVDAALAGKLDKSGGTVTGNLKIFPSTSSEDANLALDGGADVIVRYRINNITRRHSTDAGLATDTFTYPSMSGTIALAAPSPTPGNLAALDANGNPTDSGIASSDVATKTLVGQFMPETPTQNELAEAVKKIFVALGGTITNGTQNVEAGRGLE